MTANPNNISPSSDKELEEKAKAATDALQAWLVLYRGYLDIFLDAYCIVDTSNRVIEFNAAFTNLVGQSYRRVIKIGDFCELLRTELCPTQCPAKQVLTSQRSFRIDEIHASSKAGNNFTLIMGGVPIVWSGVGTVGSLITIRDVSAANELQRKYDERKKDSITDGLTRLYNKIYTESVLLRTVKTALREGRPISVVMCDIDHFKSVNDQYGHQAGDHVLAQVAHILKTETRGSDVAGRFGGEEFMAILYNTPPEGTKVLTERFRKRVEETVITFDGKRIPVTVSLGTATLNDKWSPDLDTDRMSRDLIAKADTALYLAKANGRNQTRQFEDIPQKKKA